jgi:hypothetical protein
MTHCRLALLLCVTLVAATGCGAPKATLVTDHPPLGHHRFETDRAAYQFSRGRVLDITVECTWPPLAPGEPTDLEYVHIVVPDRAGTYHVGGDKGPARVTRLVRVGNEEMLYRAISGSVRYRFAIPDKDHVEVEVAVELERVSPWATTGGRSHLEGTIRATERITLAQGLINKHKSAIARLDPAPAPKASE